MVGPGETGAGTGLAAPLPSLRFIRHIEANATARMRRHRIRRAVLYTNMRPYLGEDALANLRELADSLDTSVLTAHGALAGNPSPDGRPDWLIVIEYAEDGTDRGLFSVGPDDL